MIADNATPFRADNNSMFCPQFKPLQANNGFQGSPSGNPFAQDISQEFSPAAHFTMKPEFQNFVPAAPNTPFTPVSPISPGQTMNPGANMVTNANPFTFVRSESSTFVPTAQSPLMSEQRQFNAAGAATFDAETSPMAFMQNGQMVPLTETKKYKREMCKNWTEVGFCRYGLKCQYAHGAEELAEIDRITEAQARLNDKYKSQNCRQFYREKLCPYGKRCHFRHEYRSFKKIHRHYFMAHLAAMSLTYEDVLIASKNAPDGSEPVD